MLKLVIILGVISCTLALPYDIEDEEAERIVGGTDAKLGEIPYIVSLRYKNKHFCGGSILDNLHILTAAHCLDLKGLVEKDFTIQYGVVNISSNQNVIQVAKMYKHEDFDKKKRINDIAVLKLVDNIRLSPDTQIVFLPKLNEEPPSNNWAILAGWGHEKTGGSVQNILQKVDILVYPDNNCTKIHTNPQFDKRYHLCSGIPEGGKGQCNGDSGGPLIAHGKQIGVVSFSQKPCTKPNSPGVYARVGQYIEWIYKQMSKSD